MVIDTTINIGNVLVAVFAIISFAVAFTKLGGGSTFSRRTIGTLKAASVETFQPETPLYISCDIAIFSRSIATRVGHDNKTAAKRHNEKIGSDLRPQDKRQY